MAYAKSCNRSETHISDGRNLGPLARPASLLEGVSLDKWKCGVVVAASPAPLHSHIWPRLFRRQSFVLGQLLLQLVAPQTASRKGDLTAGAAHGPLVNALYNSRAIKRLCGAACC